MELSALQAFFHNQSIWSRRGNHLYG